MDTKELRKELDIEYDKSLEEFRAESRKFRIATEKYRSKKIGDDEFLAARQQFSIALSISDKAERDYIDKVNSLESKHG